MISMRIALLPWTFSLLALAMLDVACRAPARKTATILEFPPKPKAA